jgi:hypothetical protein
VFGTLIAPLFQALSVLINDLFLPFKALWSLLQFLMRILIEVVTPIITLVAELIKLKLSLLKLILLPPSLSLMRLLMLFRDGFLGLVSVIQEGLMFFKRYIKPLSNPRNREATLGFLQICQQIGLQWSQSISKRVI